MLALSGTTTLVGIIGNPVSHSLSPRMQNAAFAAAGLDWAYVPLPVCGERVGEAVRGLVALGFAGANVTIPHKGAVIAHCDEVEGIAAEADSVNTLVV
ncbi:MAG: shikimate dehydrogenase, partial [Actinobacteria bacterium]|nr:shikimate dehydrogenase [Actinomycetota bacterium]